MKLQRFFKLMVQKGASDLFLRFGALPRARIDGQVQYLDQTPVSQADMSELLAVLFDDRRKRDIFEQNRDVDFIYNDPGSGRFRVSVFYQRTIPVLVARYVKNQTKSFSDLSLPVELCEMFAQEKRCLILACGPAGSGKTTAIASIIDYINFKQEKHIVTLEDPIEFLFKDKKSMINQREMGIDFYSYPMALRHVTQQSPDIIFIGTIRDEETMRAALAAAELGALVVSTFHTNNAVQTLERIINFFPPHLHAEISLQLSMLLKGVLSLRLLPRKDGQGRIPAYESMVATPTITRLIRERSVREIQPFINDGKLFGMKAFKQTLAQLVRDGVVDQEDARNVADSKDDFDLEIKGIKSL